MAGIFKKNVIRPVRNSILFLMLCFMFLLCWVLPRKMLLFWHASIARLFYRLMSKTRRIVTDNLQIAFGPEQTPGQYHKMGRNVFITITKSLTDYAIWGIKKTRKQFSKYFEFKGEENLKAAYEKGRGVLCLIPHTLCWEFSAIMPPVLGYKTCGVSSKIRNVAVNRLMVGLRESRGMKNIVRDHSYETLVDRLKSGECLIIMIDQDSMKVKGEFLNFFGKTAYTPIGCARLAYDTGAAVVPMFTIRNNQTDTYTFEILPEIPFEQKETYLESMRYNTQKYNDVIESLIRKNPEQWVWMHERWKTTPESLMKYLEYKDLESRYINKQ